MYWLPQNEDDWPGLHLQLPPLPPYNEAVLIPGQVPQNDQAPNPGEAGPILLNVLALNLSGAVPNVQNAPAPNPGQADPIQQNALAPNQGQANQPNATSRLSMVWRYFINHLIDFLPPNPLRIISNVAFCHPAPSYSIDVVNGRNTLRLQQNGPNQLTPEQLSRIEVFKTNTIHQNEIVCMFIPFQNAEFTLFISHGHDVDIGQRCTFYYDLGIRMECNVFAYDYSGYGCSTGIASEANMYADAEAALRVLTDTCNIEVEQIIFYGHTLGTAAAIHLARKREHEIAAGLILIAPFKSGLRVFFPNMPFNSRFDCFRNIDKIYPVWCFTLFIEPRDDVLFGRDTGHAVALRARLRRNEEGVPQDDNLIASLEGRRYNDVEESEDCLERLHEFITNVAGPQPAPVAINH